MSRRGAPASLTTGAAIALLASLATAAAMLILLLAGRNAEALRQLEERALTGRAAVIIRHLEHRPEGWRLALPEDVAAAFSPAYGRAAFAVVDAEGRFLVGANAAAPLTIPDPGPAPRPFTLDRAERDWRGLAIPAVIDGQALSIQVAEDLQHPDVLLDDAASEFVRDVVWLVLPVFLVLCLAMLWLLQRLKRPLRDLAAQAEGIAAGGAGGRLREDGVPRELLPMLRTFNEALARLEAAQAEQRGFIADAAHELRTPLAVLQAQLDLVPDRAAAAPLARDLGVLERMVGQLLAIAALDDRALRPDRRLDLRLLAADLADYLTPLAEARGIALDCATPALPVMVLAEEEALSQALVNLLENAIGHSPEGGTVRLTVTAAAQVEVADSGPGIPEFERKLVFRRFWRSRRRQQAGRGGAGLGLAIVQRAAEIHGGSVAVGGAPGGGACFTLALRPAPPG
ncbi:ATP-binding protein [Roseomonas sp. USHLN139]|uniref:ATP-binding protein n=1 Tax=Roseomonas sp. USHLN139 TaxID=3081298 RepID=UPI003B026E74